VLTDEVDGFLGYLSVEKGHSSNTICAYAHDIRTFIDFIENIHEDKENLSPSDITHLEIRAYLADLQRRGYSKRTIARRLAAVRAFFFLSLQERAYHPKSCKRHKNPERRT